MWNFSTFDPNKTWIGVLWQLIPPQEDRRHQNIEIAYLFTNKLMLYLFEDFKVKKLDILI